MYENRWNNTDADLTIASIVAKGINQDMALRVSSSDRLTTLIWVCMVVATHLAKQ